MSEFNKKEMYIIRKITSQKDFKKVEPEQTDLSSSIFKAMAAYPSSERFEIASMEDEVITNHPLQLYRRVDITLNPDRILEDLENSDIVVYECIEKTRIVVKRGKDNMLP